MKKNISINIGGIIFHIEEDGYEKLSNYLKSVNKYFSGFEDSKEIIDDIESRIAEIFLTKLSDVKQVISIVDVEELIATMGTTSDFDATIEVEPEDLKSGQENATPKRKAEEKKKEKQNKEKTYQEAPASKKLYRNTRKKVLGGVASGLAYYFKIDPIWIRLIFIVLFINGLFPGVSGAILLAYIILWIAVPGMDLEDEDSKIKKLYRAYEDRVLGGVCSGLASYFGTDVAVIRLIFVITLFVGGIGFIAYIILWIITPEARTITEKMQMQGEPVTLSNIEENVKKSLNVKEGEDENTITKVLLFPFRLIALIINGLSKALGPFLTFLVEALRILAGVILVIVGISMIFSFIVSFTVLLGWNLPWSGHVQSGDFPLEMFIGSISPFASLSAFLTVLIPAIGLTLLGFMIILKRKIGTAYLGWSLFGLWIVGLLMGAYFIPREVAKYRVENQYREERRFDLPEGKVNLALNDLDIYYDEIDLRLRGHEDSTFLLSMEFEGRGFDSDDAKEYAQKAEYNVTQAGTQLIFDSDVTIPQGAFRFQQLDATLYIPVGRVFTMGSELSRILTNTLYLDGYWTGQMEGNDWIFEKNGLKCLTCEEVNNINRRSRSQSQRSRINTFNGDEIRFANEDFKEIKVSSYYKVFIEQDSEYSVVVKGNERRLEDVAVNQSGDRLTIRNYDDDINWLDVNSRGRGVNIFITMPELESIELNGAVEGEIYGFDDKDVEINLNGASVLKAEIFPDFLEINLDGASDLKLIGDSRNVDARVNGASKLSAIDFQAKYMDLRVDGASKALVYVIEDLNGRCQGLSSIRYKGNPRISIDRGGFSTIKRY